MVYDALGRRTDVLDPDLGHIAYTVDPLGQVYKQLSPLQAAACQSTTKRYDDLGRMFELVDVSLRPERRWHVWSLALACGHRTKVAEHQRRRRISRCLARRSKRSPGQPKHAGELSLPALVKYQFAKKSVKNVANGSIDISTIVIL